MIRIDHIWLGVEPVDMRSGMYRLLMQVVAVFGQAHLRHAYLFANRRAHA
ncbi:MAG: IS66 family insertion sequence element accessory protein TnpB [Corticimicrobacter sp.]